MSRILVLGGTTEASSLATRLAGRSDLTIVTSFAGRTSTPVRPPGEVRVGGFGGVDGLARYLVDEPIDVVVDATHPFAARMRWHALEAAERVGVPRVRLERPGWQPEAGDDWRPVPDLDAAAVAAGRFDRVFLTTGRTELAPFAACTDVWFLVRAIERPTDVPLSHYEAVLARGPFSVDDEAALLRSHRIDAVVTKNSGGSATEAKVVAARRLGLPVIVVDRPPSPAGPQVETVDQAVAWLAEVVQ